MTRLRAPSSSTDVGLHPAGDRLQNLIRDVSPGAPEGTLALAERLIGAGKLPDAIEVLNKITSAEPENGQAWRVLGETLASQQRVEEGISALQRAVALGVPEAEVARPLGLALLRAGRPERPDLWSENAALVAEGWVDYQAHGVIHNET